MRLLMCLVALLGLSLSVMADTTLPGAGAVKTSKARKGSGVEGTVDLGPTKPVTRPGEKDTSPVVGAKIVALDKNGKEVASTKTDKNGHYSLKLKPGKYTIVGPKGGIPPLNFKQEVEVKQSWSKLDMHLDTGIRATPMPPVRK
jgi:hypothetical protein